MSLEIALLLLGVITMLTIGFEIIYVYATQGFRFGFSANRPAVERSAFGKRVSNIYRNQSEAVTYMAPVLAAALFVGVDAAGVQVAALVMIAARIGFVLTYYTGIHFVRVPFFLFGSLATLYTAVNTMMAAGA